jgi:hypothetical protein
MSMLEFFKRGQAARDVRLTAAQGALEAKASELLSILVLLLNDEDEEIRTTARDTLRRLPAQAVDTFLATTDVAAEVRTYFRAQMDADAAVVNPPRVGEAPAAAPPGDGEPNAIASGAPGAGDAAASSAEEAVADPADAALDPELEAEDNVDRESILQKLAKMKFSDKLKAASKGSREVRAILVRDPSKMIAMAVLSSPKLTEPEVAAFARMGNVSEDVLRTIGANRAWMKNYNIIVALTKNAKTPVAMSMNLMHRLNDRDLSALSTDRNVPEPLRVAARKKIVSAVSR